MALMTEWPVNGYVKNVIAAPPLSYASTLRGNKRRTVIKRLTLVASESGKIKAREPPLAGYREKRAAPATGSPHLRGSKKTFRSTTNALLMMADGPLANAPRFARTTAEIM